jgi:DNA-binding response OmpR family regulator
MSGKRRTRTILVIEDEADIQNFISRTLELEGFVVCRTRDGASGLKIIRNDHFSLVLLDLRLPPGPDGWAILRELKRDPGLSIIPVVVLTASAEAAQRRRTLRMGAASYLVKPISAHELIQTVRSIMKQAAHTTGRAKSPAP